MKSTFISILAIGLLALQAGAEDKKAPLPAKAPQLSFPQKPALPDEAPPSKEKISQAVGVLVGNSIKSQMMEIDTEVMTKALKDMLSGKPTPVTLEEAQTTMRNYQRGMAGKVEAQRKEQGEKNVKIGEDFLAANAKKAGVTTLPSGLQYKVLKEGTGAIPKASDRVSVHYAGTLIDGTEFDSSVKRGKPASFAVGGVIKGWTEALQLMKTGSKWQLFIPSALAYGEQGGGPKIGPNAVLLFDVELLTIDTPPPATTNQVVSGEIIKVPSAEELKKGAKIEVIKSSDVNALKPK
jgi:FKBP-type peptidyl-prolyl cis-trans isomerase FklB